MSTAATPTNNVISLHRAAANDDQQPTTPPPTVAPLDDWGRDHQLAARFWQLSKLRWDLAVGGTHHLPETGGGLIVVNQRHLALAPIFTALAIGAHIDRPIRFAGRVDVTPVGPLVQRLGGLITHFEEISSTLAHGEIVLLAAEPELTNEHCGRIDHHLVGAAVTTDTPVFPAAVISSPGRRSGRIEIGQACIAGDTRRGPLAELELADAIRDQVDTLLIEHGAGPANPLFDILSFANRVMR